MKQLSWLKLSKIFLGILFVIVIIYNFQVANSTKYDTDGDALSFIILGVSLSEHGKYGNVSAVGGIKKVFQENTISKDNIPFVGYSNWRPPVWPYIIGIIFIIFGYSLTYLLIFKFLLHILGVFFFYKTIKLLKIKTILIYFGTFLYGVSPAWQLYSRVFLSEPITLFFITVWIYFLIRFVMGKSGLLPQAFLGGILVLSHPYYIFLPFSVFAILFLYKRIKLRHLILASSITAAVLSVWIIRNFVVLETNEIVLTTSSGAVMAKGWNKKVTEDHTNTKGDLADEALVFEGFEPEEDYFNNEVQTMKKYKDASIYFIRNNPDQILPIIGKKLSSAFNPFPETSKPGILETGRWFFHFLSLLALIFILFFSKNALLKSLSWALVIATVGITILTYSGFRFRMPQSGLELLLILGFTNEILNMNKAKLKYYHPHQRVTNSTDL